MIGYGRQDITDEDILAVTDVLRSDFLTQGDKVPEFEKRISAFVNAKYCFAVNSATSALHIACLALDLGPGDIAWTSPNTFVASANCALYCGAEVDFVDIDAGTGNLSLSHLAKKLDQAERSGKLPKVIIAVHFAGSSVDMKTLKGLVDPYGIRIIEDASHALGGEFRDEKIGHCLYSDMAVFSFHPVKMITTGEGGAVVCQDDALAQKLNILRSHGITRDKGLMRSKAPEPWFYEQLSLGMNYRMTDFQAALGISQLKRLPDFVARRSEIAGIYDQQLADLPVGMLAIADENRSSHHLYVIKVDKQIRASLFNYLREHGIGVNVHYIPVHLQPFFQDKGFTQGDFPQAEAYYASAISIPIFYQLTDDEIGRVIDTIRNGLSHATAA